MLTAPAFDASAAEPGEAERTSPAVDAPLLVRHRFWPQFGVGFVLSPGRGRAAPADAPFHLDTRDFRPWFPPLRGIEGQVGVLFARDQMLLGRTYLRIGHAEGSLEVPWAGAVRYRSLPVLLGAEVFSPQLGPLRFYAGAALGLAVVTIGRPDLDPTVDRAVLLAGDVHAGAHVALFNARLYLTAELRQNLGTRVHTPDATFADHHLAVVLGIGGGFEVGAVARERRIARQLAETRARAERSAAARARRAAESRMKRRAHEPRPERHTGGGAS